MKSAIAPGQAVTVSAVDVSRVIFKVFEIWDKAVDLNAAGEK